MARLSYGRILKLTRIVKQFVPEGKIDNIESFGGGRINSTYLISMRQGNERVKYLLQNVNNTVFRDTEGLMKNVIAVTEYIREHGGCSLEFIKCSESTNSESLNGPYIFVDEENLHWRMYNYVEAEVYPCIIESEDAYMLGEAIADFSRSLDGFDATELFETIPGFHDTLKRFETFLLAVANDVISGAKRCEGVKAEIEFLLNHKDDMGILVNALNNGEIFYGVTHNDPKINNALFDKVTGKPICMIDLDTVMSGTPLFDIGDALRSIANTDSEDAKTTENVSFSLEIYEAFVEGYIKGMKDCLTDKEKELIPYSPLVIGLELGMRFLMDHIQGNIYFKTEYDGQNIERARVQFALVEDIERKLKSGELHRILKKAETDLN